MQLLQINTVTYTAHLHTQSEYNNFHSKINATSTTNQHFLWLSPTHPDREVLREGSVESFRDAAVLPGVDEAHGTQPVSQQVACQLIPLLGGDVESGLQHC